MQPAQQLLVCSRWSWRDQPAQVRLKGALRLERLMLAKD
jgi:hypothetical protein